jgi:type VI protein secretion system component Hcp
MPKDIFADLGDIKGESFSHQVDHNLISLGTDFDLVGGAFNDLIADALKVTDISAHKHVSNIKWTEALIKHDVDTIGFDFIKLGDDFLKLDEVQHKFDDMFIKFADQFITFTAGLKTDQGDIKLSDDFLKLETDLKLTGDSTTTLGLDFLKLNDANAENASAVFLKIADDFHKIDDSMSSLGDDFLKIGVDYKLAEINVDAIKLNEADTLKLDEALHKLGTDNTTIGIDFHKLSDDFLQIATDIAESSRGDQPTESLSLNFSKIAFKYSEDFQQLDSDAHKLELDLKLLGDDTIKLTESLHNGLLPAVQHTDSLDQVLALVHHFSLL